jgi:hypothetical protein
VSHRGALRALLFFVCLPLLAPSGDGGCGAGDVALVPLAGDTHHHAGSLISEFVAYQKRAGLGTACPHDFGKPLHVYDRNQAAGYDWLVIAHHDRATHGGMTGDPNGTAVFKSHPGAYAWWSDPRSAPLRLRDGTLLSDPNPLGLPNYVTGGVVSPGWNEARSLGSAAERKNATTPGNFVAFAGREYTTNDGFAVSAARGYGGHKVAVLPGPTDRICGYLGSAQGRANDCDETGLYDWVFQQGGVIIQAHPGDWAVGTSHTWHPDLRPAGLADAFVHGVEVGAPGGLLWENGYQAALARGYRVFPSFGSDRHSLQLDEMGIGCKSSAPPSLVYGAVICWAPPGGSPTALADAMRERRCYYSRSWKPRLVFELRDSTRNAPVPMGGVVSVPDRVAVVRVSATNDVRNQPTRRFGRLELVQPSGWSTTERVVYACTSCCTRSDTGDRCTLNTSLPIADGAVYARICSGTAPCGRNGANTRVVSAPVFVNWVAYKRARGLSLDTAYDFDADGWPAVWDNCWTDSNVGQQDTDGDGAGNACDVCPGTPDPLQLDGNRDGRGDACS